MAFWGGKLQLQRRLYRGTPPLSFLKPRAAKQIKNKMVTECVTIYSFWKTKLHSYRKYRTFCSLAWDLISTTGQRSVGTQVLPSLRVTLHSLYRQSLSSITQEGPDLTRLVVSDGQSDRQLPNACVSTQQLWKSRQKVQNQGLPERQSKCKGSQDCLLSRK